MLRYECTIIRRDTASTPWLVAALGALGALLALAPLPARAQDRAESVTLDRGDVTIYNLAGEVTIEPTDRSAVTVLVTRGGADAGGLRIATGVIGGRQTLRVIYPERRVVYPKMGRGSRTNLRVRDDGTFGGNNTSRWLDRNSVTIAGSGSGFEGWADLRVLVPRGQDVQVRVGVGGASARDVDAELGIDMGSGEVSTEHTRGTLSIDTGSGDVRVATARGPVSVDTGSGSIELSGVRGDELSVDTGSGSVTIRDVDVADLAVDTGSGDVSLEGINAPRVKVETGSGGVDADLVSDVESLTIETGSGQVTVKVPKDAGAIVALDTGSGSLDVAMPVTSLRRDHGELRAQIGDGRGRIDVETGSGGVRIESR